MTPAARLSVLPDVRTIGGFLPGCEVGGFAGIGVPKGAPADIVNLLNMELHGALVDTKIKVRIEELGGTVTAGSPAELGTLIAEATEKWAKVIKFAGIKAE